MAAKDPLIEKLRKTRPDYQEEVRWHRFLLDAICSTGGFKGKVGPTAASFLGWAAEAYARTTLASQAGATAVADTYLDQFPREDLARFTARINVSHYVNYTGPILETLLSYISKEEMGYDGRTEDVTAWMDGDVDGKGSTWSSLMVEQVRPRCCSLGWCPVLFDLPETDGNEISQARAKEQGIDVRALPLYPMNILDWSVNDRGALTAAKIRIDVVTRDNLLGDEVREERYDIWTQDEVRRVVVRVLESGDEVVHSDDTIAHSHGCVPLVSFRASRVTDDDVLGPSIIGDLARVNRRIFNLDSELDDHLRNACFALLQVPMKDTKQNVGEMVGGSGIGFKIPMDSSRDLAFVAPPATVPEAMENRREVLVREVYRCARVEHAKPTGVTTSGIARAYEFEQTNRRLGDIAAGFARSEQSALRLVSKMKRAEAEAAKLTVTSPEDFSVEDMTADIENVVQSQSLKFGPTADAEIKRRMVRRMLPNIPTDTMAEIDAEIDEMRDQQEQDDALAREVANATLKQGGEGGDEPEPGTGGGVN